MAREKELSGTSGWGVLMTLLILLTYFVYSFVIGARERDGFQIAWSAVLAGLDPDNLLVPIDIPPPWPALILPLCESPPEFVGHDPGLAPRGSPSQLRALTQRYRF